jgi:hypothetical protein
VAARVAESLKYGKALLSFLAPSTMDDGVVVDENKVPAAPPVRILPRGEMIYGTNMCVAHLFDLDVVMIRISLKGRQTDAKGFEKTKNRERAALLKTSRSFFHPSSCCQPCPPQDPFLLIYMARIVPPPPLRPPTCHPRQRTAS